MKTAGYVLGLSLLGFVGYGMMADSTVPIAPTVQVTAPTQAGTPTKVYSQPAHYSQNTYQEAQLSNDNYYTNVAGNQVHSPAYTEDYSVPAGASARCRDGTYSFSQNRRGTCSHHGGVAEWL